MGLDPAGAAVGELVDNDLPAGEVVPAQPGADHVLHQAVHAGQAGVSGSGLPRARLPTSRLRHDQAEPL